MIWSISESLRWSQNFVKNWKIFMTAVLSEISDFDHFLIILISDLWVSYKSQNGILKCFFVDLKHFWKFEVESKFCQKLKIFMTMVLSEISDFDHFLNILISDLWVNCKSQNGILKCSFVDLKHFWKFEVDSNLCQKLKIFMTAVFSEISDFDHFLNILISDLWVNYKSQNGILKCSFVDLKHFWKFEVESKFCQKLKIFMTSVFSEISDFDHFLIIVISDLWVNCKSQNGIPKCFVVDLKHFWKFEVESKFCQKLKIFMTAVLSEISDFDHFSNILISDLWVNYKSQNGILKCSFVDLKHFWKFEVDSKFCQKLKIFMTAVLSKISDFDHFLNILISDLWVNCKSQNGILKCSFVYLKHFWKFEVKSKFCQKLKIFMTAVLNKIFRFWPLFHPFRFWPVSELQVSKWYSKVFFCWFEAFLKVWGGVKILSKIENFHDRGP